MTPTPPATWPPLTERELLQCIFDNCNGNTVRLTRESGPYEVTELTHDGERLLRAVEHAVRRKAAEQYAAAMREAAPVQEPVARMRSVGAQLANVAFNWAQRPGHVLTGDDAALLDKLRRQWDEALYAAPAAPASQPREPLSASAMLDRMDNELRRERDPRSVLQRALIMAAMLPHNHGKPAGAVREAAEALFGQENVEAAIGWGAHGIASPGATQTEPRVGDGS
jgi:hypothetical protein